MDFNGCKKDPLKVYLWDASAFIKLFIDEGKGTRAAKELKVSNYLVHYYTKYTVTEALSQIKRYWKDAKINDDSYTRLVWAILDSSLEFKECPATLEQFSHLQDAFKIVKEYGIDIIDAAAIIGIQNGTPSLFGGASGPYLVTADGKMLKAAMALNIKFIDLRESKL